MEAERLGVGALEGIEEDALVPGEPIPLTNQFMFGRIMCDEEICRQFLERLLGISVDSIEYLNAKQVLEPTLTGKGSELDLYVRAREGAFDIEMQCRPRGSLGRRFRFYQGAMDTRDLRKGADYDQLPESAIVFVCGYDPFRRGAPIYRIRPACEEAGEGDIGFGAQWVAMNCPAWEREADPALRNLLQYFANGARAEGDELVGRMSAAVAEANRDERWVSSVFSVSTVLDDERRERRIAVRAARREGEQAGLKQGIEQGEGRLGALVAALLADGRAPEAAAAASDPGVRERLYGEYGL